MKLGLDIATVTLKKILDRIVVIAGDEDFVPALKFARKEGISVTLDPMWHGVSDNLYEHIDTLKTFAQKPDKQ